MVMASADELDEERQHSVRRQLLGRLGELAGVQGPLPLLAREGVVESGQQQRRLRTVLLHRLERDTGLIRDPAEGCPGVAGLAEHADGRVEDAGSGLGGLRFAQGRHVWGH